MRKLNRIGVVFAAVAAAGLTAGAASAGGSNLDLDEMAAALALPVITGGHGPNQIKGTRGDVIVKDDEAITLATITNGSSSGVLLKIDVISGDPGSVTGGDTWQSDSFECYLTGRETTTFLFVPAGDGSLVYVECSDGFLGFPVPVVRAVKAQNGILWAAVADNHTKKMKGQDLIFGDAIVADLVWGQAYSFGAIPFQAGKAPNNGDKVFKFDDQEYARFPGALATNFIAPVPNKVNAELILFTLDGTAGNPTVPRVMVGGLGYNDDEAFFDFQHEFDCFDIVALEDMTLNFTNDLLGSLSGHLQLVAQPVATANDVHDAQYGDGNNVRTRPAHGWIVQNVLAGKTLVPAGQPIPQQSANLQNNGPGPAAWGRPLQQSRTGLTPFLNDGHPTLDADPLY